MSATSYFSEFAKEFNGSRLLPAVSVGLLSGVIQVMLAVSFAALIFTGPLNGFLVDGMGFALMSAILGGGLVALFTSAPGVVSGNQNVPSAIMAVTVVALANVVPAGAGSRELFVTVVVLIGLTTMLTGAFFYGMGRFGLGNLVRFLPYPVVGGFLAGTGWLVLVGGIEIMVDAAPSPGALALLVQPTQLVRWVPGLLLALAILVVLRRTQHPLALPGMVLGGAALFYAVAALGGRSVEFLSSNGWLLGPFPQRTLWQSLALSDISLVHWPAMLGQAAGVATLILMSSVALLLNGSGLELALKQDLSLDRELRVAGLSNLAAGAAGGLVSFQQISLSVLNVKVAGPGRLAGLVAVALCTVVLFTGASLISLVPKLVLGALLCYLGLAFLLDTLVDDWNTLPRSDYLVIVLILLVTAAVGFMEAVGVGALVAVFLFVFNYSRTGIVRNELTGRSAQSRVTRSPQKARQLHEHGQQLLVLRLQGFIFFGTADRLLNHIRGRLDDPQSPSPRYLLLDFCHVTGVDSTALLIFAKLIHLAQQRRLTLVLAAPTREIEWYLHAGERGDGIIHVFPDLDRGLEWCEEQLLASIAPHTEAGAGLQRELARRLDGAETAARLIAYFERQESREGHVLMRQGEDADAMYLVESGQMTAYLEEPEGAMVRLQTMQDWNVLGEIGFFLGTKRTASVIAEAPGVVYCLSRQALATMQRDDPELAAALHKLIVQLLAERVVHLVSVVDALQR